MSTAAVRTPIGASTEPEDPLRHVRLVQSIAREYRGRGLAVEDLEQEGFLGLLRACARFDPRRRVAFGSFAALVIRRALQRALINQAPLIRVPAYLLTARSGLYHGRLDPADVRPSRRARLERAEAILSRGHRREAGPALAELAVAPEDDGPECDEISRLRAALDELPEGERAVIRLRYGLDGGTPRSLREAGEARGHTGERIRQVQEKALVRLRERLAPGAPAATPIRAPAPAPAPIPATDGRSKAPSLPPHPLVGRLLAGLAAADRWVTSGELRSWYLRGTVPPAAAVRDALEALADAGRIERGTQTDPRTARTYIVYRFRLPPTAGSKAGSTRRA